MALFFTKHCVCSARFCTKLNPQIKKVYGEFGDKIFRRAAEQVA